MKLHRDILTPEDDVPTRLQRSGLGKKWYDQLQNLASKGAEFLGLPVEELKRWWESGLQGGPNFAWFAVDDENAQRLVGFATAELQRSEGDAPNVWVLNAYVDSTKQREDGERYSIDELVEALSTEQPFREAVPDSAYLAFYTVRLNNVEAFSEKVEDYGFEYSGRTLNPMLVEITNDAQLQKRHGSRVLVNGMVSQAMFAAEPAEFFASFEQEAEA